MNPDHLIDQVDAIIDRLFANADEDPLQALELLRKAFDLRLAYESLKHQKQL
jgi:hypothetical protein